MSESTSTNIRHAFFILAGAVALVLTWPHAFRWMAAGGNILNPVAFFGDAIAAGGTAAFLSIDMAIAWLVFMVWVVFDSKRIGLGYKCLTSAYRWRSRCISSPVSGTSTSALGTTN
jgi:hypothetical protein